MRVTEGRRRAREGPAQRGRGGEGRGEDSVIGAPPPSRPWAGDGRARGSKLLSDLPSPGQRRGLGPANPCWLPNLPQLSQGLDLPQSRSRPARDSLCPARQRPRGSVSALQGTGIVPLEKKISQPSPGSFSGLRPTNRSWGHNETLSASGKASSDPQLMGELRVRGGRHKAGLHFQSGTQHGSWSRRVPKM